jgi:prefoldin alpha subunit
MDEQKMQEKALKIQILEQQIIGVQNQLQNLEAQLVDLDITKESLDDLKKSEKGSELLSMLSPGIFVKSNLADNKDVIINVGAGVAVKKDVDKAKELVEQQFEEVKKVQLQLLMDMEKLNEAIIRMEKEE